MTPAEQAQQADLFCSKHQGHARKHGRRRDADGDGDDPTGAEVLRRAGRFDTLAPAIAQAGAQRRFADVA
jgi:hypothetical protein